MRPPAASRPPLRVRATLVLSRLLTLRLALCPPKYYRNGAPPPVGARAGADAWQDGAWPAVHRRKELFRLITSSHTHRTDYH